MTTEKQVHQAAVIINAAGVHADEIHNMVCEDRITLIPRRGEYLLLDKTAGSHVRHTIFRLPDEMGKGVLVTPTIHGNLLVGPTAEDIPDKEDTRTTAAAMRQIAEKASAMVADLPMRQVITSFSGLRAHSPEHDFRIGEVPGTPGFIDCAGIESPGLSASPAIGEMAAGLAADRLRPAERREYIAVRRGITRCSELTPDERTALIRKDPAYGNIVCRCEGISEGEIREAVRRVPGARSLDGVKRRTRAGMGRCQSGFCSPRTMKILSDMIEEYGAEDITKCGPGSEILLPEAASPSPHTEKHTGQTAREIP